VDGAAVIGVLPFEINQDAEVAIGRDETGKGMNVAQCNRWHVEWPSYQ